MAKKTITVQTIVENIVLEKTGKTKHEFNSHIEMIKIAQDSIFDKYPLFDEKYREELNTKILSHYYFREIIVSPYQRWRFYMNESLYLKMEIYNKLYETTMLEYDVFDNVDYTETLDRDLTSLQTHKNTKTEDYERNNLENKSREIKDKLTSEQNQDTSSDSSSKKVNEDTPYSRLGNVDYATEIDETTSKEKLANNSLGTQEQDMTTTDLNKIQDNRETHSTSDNDTRGENTEDYVKRIFGKTGGRSKSELIMELRRSFINVDLMVIEMLKDNFSGYFN